MENKKEISKIWKRISDKGKDCNGDVPLIGYFTNEPDEVGVPILIISLTKIKDKYYKEKINYLDNRAITDPLVNSVIEETIKNFLLI